MLEYAACTLLGFVMIGCLLYVMMSPEAEEAPKPKWRLATRSNREAARYSPPIVSVATSLVETHVTGKERDSRSSAGYGALRVH
jgi:hypothetical protein